MKHEIKEGICKRCNGSESNHTLPIECPGSKMGTIQKEAISKNQLEYFRKSWCMVQRVPAPRDAMIPWMIMLYSAVNKRVGLIIKESPYIKFEIKWEDKAIIITEMPTNFSEIMLSLIYAPTGI